MRLLIGSATAFALLAMASSSLAQSQGSLGSTSTGSHDVSLTLTQPTATSNQVRITGLSNVSMGSFPTNYVQDIVGRNYNVCFYHNSPTFKLTISRTSNPEKSKGFKLVSSTGNEIPLRFDLYTGATSFSNAYTPSIIDGIAINGVTGNNSSETCSSGGKGYLFYSVGTDGKLPANTPAGNYSATFQITLAAE